MTRSPRVKARMPSAHLPQDWYVRNANDRDFPSRRVRPRGRRPQSKLAQTQRRTRGVEVRLEGLEISGRSCESEVRILSRLPYRSREKEDGRILRVDRERPILS